MGKIDPLLFEKESFAGDITKVDPAAIPDFDVLAGGFPCQPFSHAGKRLGFDDARGTLFFNVAEIIRVKRPKAYFLENVRGLLNHDDGKTFATVKRILTEDLGYSFFHKIVKASDFGLPQHRPRIYMIGFANPEIEFEFPKPIPLALTMSDVLGGRCEREIGFTLRCGGRGSPIEDRRNWDSYLVDGRVVQIGVEEGKAMQGFPKDFEFPVSETQAMRQLGNSVAIPAVAAHAAAVRDALIEYGEL